MDHKPYKLAVFIGRFQPFHIGHRTVLEHATTYADSALVIIGSAFRPRTPKNPLSFEERAALITAGLPGVDLKCAFIPLIDTLYDDAAWADNVRLAVMSHLTAIGRSPEDTEIILTGFEKDKSSAYVRWFPEWAWAPAPGHMHDGKTVSATDLRRVLYGQNSETDAELADWFGALQVQNLRDWAERHPGDVAQMAAEAAYIDNAKGRIKTATEVYGYPFAINTADAIILHGDHVLLVERARIPGKGQYALPGGHIDPDETGLDAVMREVMEECRLDLSVDHMTQREIFDQPGRRARGWVRTDIFVFSLPNNEPRPPLIAGDDAAHAKWVPLRNVQPENMYEDHFDILQMLTPEFPFTYAECLTGYMAYVP